MGKENSVEILKFYFPYSKPTYNEYLAMIHKEKLNYDKEITVLKDEKDTSFNQFSMEKAQKLIEKHRQLVNDVLMNIINFYQDLLDEKEVCIFWTGSFGRHSNRFSADYDLNFTYKDESRERFLPIEEQICYAFATILGKPRDYVHPVKICRNELLRDISQFDSTKQMICKMKFGDGETLEYKISPRLEKLMYKIYYAKRNPELVKRRIEYLITPDKCYEWEYVLENIYGDEIFNYLIKDFKKNEVEKLKHEGYAKEFNDLLERYKTCLAHFEEELDTINLNEVKNIKVYLKKKPLDYIYDTLALIRRRLMFEGKDIGFIRMDKYSKEKTIQELLGESLCKEFFDASYYYIWIVIRLETMFERKSIRFGSHSLESIGEEFNEFYRQNCIDVRGDLGSYHKNKIKELYKVLDQVLGKIQFI